MKEVELLMVIIVLRGIKFRLIVSITYIPVGSRSITFYLSKILLSVILLIAVYS